MHASISRLNLLRGASQLLLAALLTAPANAADKVEWRNDYDSARKEATEQNKPLFLDFGTEDCVHCKRMHQTTFKDPNIIKLLNERFIPLRVDGNREPRLTQQLRVQAYPTMILASHDGRIVGWIEGYLEPTRLSEHLQRVSALQTPDWMARDYQEVGKAVSAGEYARAVSLLRNILAIDKDLPLQAKARETLHEIEMQASGRLERAKQLDEKGQTLEALDLLTGLLSQYAGTQAAVDGAKLLPDARTRARARRAQEMLRQAREYVKEQRYLNALDQCEVLVAAYRELPEAREGAQLIREIKSDPERMSRVCEALNDRLAQMYTDLADSWRLKGDRDQETACLEKLLKVSPVGGAAARAQTRLAQLNSRTPGVPTGLEKRQE